MYKKFLLLHLFIFFTITLYASRTYENGVYPNICLLACTNDDVFANFKRDPSYQQIHEISYEEGQKYLEYISKTYPELIPYFDQFKKKDDIGNPIKYSYQEFGEFSPSTLQNIKFLGDLREKFGDLSQLNIVEIGGGCGGLCKIISTLGFASYTLVDIPEALGLAKKCLEIQEVKNVIFLDSHQINIAKKYDLVISQKAFLECDRKEQINLLKKVLKYSRKGFLTMNLISNRKNSISIEEMIRCLYHFKRLGKAEKEYLSNHAENYTITWNAKKKKSSTNYKFPLYNQATNGNAVTYSFSGGRFGDNLLAYFHAKWIAYKYKLPFLYIPFPHSDLLALDNRNQPLQAFNFTNSCSYLNHPQISSLQPNSNLITVHYSPEFYREFLTYPFVSYIKVDWDDPQFHKEVVKCLKPKQSVTTVKLPKDKITIGVHIRRGGGIDHPNAQKMIPLKFPPDSFFIEQIKRIAKIFNKQPLYVYILTDDQNPGEIVKKYKAEINDSNIQYGCRRHNNGPNRNLLEDFLLIPKFDCFILSQSNFSLIASKIKKHSIVITPLNFEFINNEPIINEFELSFNPK